ncbi:MAG: XRE family transcriptional regulator, partial [Oscillospiraceae bacterium]|nr:XRE family transcriptional regulator [Oscillospiraceae bacterium]
NKQGTLRDLVFGLLDCGIALLLFLPFFGQREGDIIREVSLLTLDGIQSYLKNAYFVFVFLMIGLGILTLALQNCQKKAWVQSKGLISLLLSAFGLCLFVISNQPYAAVFTLVFWMIKVFLMLVRR